MARVAGPSLDQLDRLGDDYAQVVADTLAVSVGYMPRPEAPEDLAVLRRVWSDHVDYVLLPALGVAFEVGAAQVRVGLREAAGLTAAAFTDVAPTSEALSEQYLAQARNRLVGVGDELWAHAREELLEGLQAGESVSELAARVRKVAPDLTEPRASVIARTEVLGAVNAGALEQVLASGATGTKQWIATDDERTRHSHDLADNDTVGLREHFTVGGFPMSGPHDPRGPAHETISCRCALSFDLDLDRGGPAGLPTGPPSGEAPTELHEGDDSPGVRQQQDRSFLARVFSDGLAALVGWFKARTAAAMIEPEQTFEGVGMTEPAIPKHWPRAEDLPEHAADCAILTTHHLTCTCGAITRAVRAATEPAAPAPEGAWEGVLVVEGTPTGDGRQFASGALTWAELPLPLKWQEREAEGHDGAVIVGRIDAIEREGDRLVGRGVFDLEGANGVEAHRLVSGGYMRGVSIMPDDISDSDVEAIFAEGQDGDPFARPELIVFNAGRVRSATLCAEAAFVEAEVRLTSDCDTCQGADALAAAGYSITIEDIPPASWFEEPTEEPAIGAITVTDEGRVFGYLAPGGVAHLGHRRNGHTIYAPMNTVDYDDKFMNKPALVRTASGQVEKIPAGNITAECGHAPIRRSNSRVAPDHYDNSCSVVARIRVGENDRGVWAAGALQPGVTADQVSRMFACQLSGDWQQHEKLTSYDELVAALLVPVPGFPKAQPASVRIRDGHLVASAVPVRYQETEAKPDLSKVKLRIARSILASRRTAAAARVGRG